jgi:transglutaminase-like putative cysteine protease
MIYQVRHLTTYHYARPVTFARCALRLNCRNDGEQAVSEEAITITPRPKTVKVHTGQFGERVATATIDTPHRELKILATSRVEVRRPAVFDAVFGEPWETVREAAFAANRIDLDSPAHFLYPTSSTSAVPAITAYAEESFRRGRSIVQAASELTRRIKADFKYDPEATEVSTLPATAFFEKKGVCQDFAHIMIAGLRALGLPVGYVSGYLRTKPPLGKPRLEGADATHAWVTLWCGAALGWIGFDPTNGIIVSSDHIILAVGRDYSDIAPIGGVILGPGNQIIKVEVDVVPLSQQADTFQLIDH